MRSWRRACPEQLAPFADVPGCAAWAVERRALKDQIKAATRRLDEVENRIKAALRSAHTLTDNGRKILSWDWAGLNNTSKKPYRILKEPKR